MKKFNLKADKREVFGRKVKSLRRLGTLPATVYGKNIQSVSLSVNSDEFLKIYQEAGETGLVELLVAGKTKAETVARPVLIHTVQEDPVSEEILHVEFHQVDLKEKVHAKVPLEFIGAPPAVELNIGVLLTVLNEIEVEALPTELPEKIIVDVAGLAEVNQELKVNDLNIPKDITVLTDAGLTVVKIGALAKVEEAPAPTPVTEEGAQVEAEEGAEGEAKEKSEKPTEAKDETKLEDKPPIKQEKKEEKK